jgi:hypothetical protein
MSDLTVPKLQAVVTLLEVAQQYAVEAWHDAMYEHRTDDRNVIGQAMLDVDEALDKFRRTF